jgi:hypothetical protein
MLKLPENWGGISITQYMEINEIIKLELSQNEYFIELISLLADIPISDVEELSYNEFMDCIKSLEFLQHKPNKHHSKSLPTKYEKLYLIDDFNRLEIGAFIDLEHFFKDDYIANLKTILAILYRRKTFNDSPFILDEFEQYGDWIFHRERLFDNISILEVYNIIPAYFKFREEFFEKYDGLLSGPVEDDSEPIQGESIISRAERIKENEKQKSINKWGWDLFLYQLANNDLTKLNDATKLNLIQAFNSLSMKREMGL